MILFSGLLLHSSFDLSECSLFPRTAPLPATSVLLVLQYLTAGTVRPSVMPCHMSVAFGLCR